MSRRYNGLTHAFAGHASEQQSSIAGLPLAQFIFAHIGVEVGNLGDFGFV